MIRNRLFLLLIKAVSIITIPVYSHCTVNSFNISSFIHVFLCCFHISSVYHTASAVQSSQTITVFFSECSLQIKLLQLSYFDWLLRSWPRAHTAHLPIILFSWDLICLATRCSTRTNMRLAARIGSWIPNGFLVLPSKTGFTVSAASCMRKGRVVYETFPCCNLDHDLTKHRRHCDLQYRWSRRTRLVATVYSSADTCTHAQVYPAYPQHSLFSYNLR